MQTLENKYAPWRGAIILAQGKFAKQMPPLVIKACQSRPAIITPVEIEAKPGRISERSHEIGAEIYYIC
ncbi:hypothetical protein ACE1ET_02575 [Saccharicrinis sp. FJH62]|uniref:hypothetical protein n=1 Tax=Saccharicrinis sp. FJH62 TaxID=3344657 RepID=UPI0035D50241